MILKKNGPFCLDTYTISYYVKANLLLKNAAIKNKKGSLKSCDIKKRH